MSNENKKPWFRKTRYLGPIAIIIAAIISSPIWGQLIFPPPPDFSISVDPMRGEVHQGGVITTAITVKGKHGYKESVGLIASGLPSDVVATFVPPTRVPTPAFTSNVMTNVGPDVPVGSYEIIIKGVGDGKEHSCKYILVVMPRSATPTPTSMPLKPYVIYSDIGIAAGDVRVWSGADDLKLEPPRLVNGSYVTADTPEGTKSFAVTSGSGHDNYVGWGVFLGIFENHNLITPHTVNLSDYEKLEFWVKTSLDLKVEIQQDNREGNKSFPSLISNYGWNRSLPDAWQKVTISRSTFINVDLTKIFSPFMITGMGNEITFYINEVRWVP